MTHVFVRNSYQTPSVGMRILSSCIFENPLSKLLKKIGEIVSRMFSSFEKDKSFYYENGFRKALSPQSRTRADLLPPVHPSILAQKVGASDNKPTLLRGGSYDDLV